MAGSMLDFVSTSDGYERAVCNIGPAEIARRRRGGYLGVAVAIVIAAVLLLLDAPSITRLLVALPVAAGLSGFIQARLRFCANYGWRGIYNLGDIGEAQRIDDAEARAADRGRSIQIFGASALGGLAIAVLFALLPL